MAIKWGQRRFMSYRRLEPGQVISFGYKGRRRVGVVIAPEYKDNADCYSYDRLEEIPEEILMYIQNMQYLNEGDLWEVFGDQDNRYRSFKRSDLRAVQSIEFVTYNENEEVLVTEDTDEDEQETANPLDNSGPSVENVS